MATDAPLATRHLRVRRGAQERRDRFGEAGPESRGRGAVPEHLGVGHVGDTRELVQPARVHARSRREALLPLRELRARRRGIEAAEGRCATEVSSITAGSPARMMRATPR